MKKIILFIMIALIICISTYAVLTQVTTTVVINASERNNFVRFELNSFNNSKTAENFTSSTLIYFEVPKYINTTNTSLNLTGLYNTYFSYQENGSNVRFANAWIASGTCTNTCLYDGVWNRWPEIQNYSFLKGSSGKGNSGYYVNYTLVTNGVSGTKWLVEDDQGRENLTINTTCFDKDGDNIELRVIANGNQVNWSCYNGSMWFVLRNVSGQKVYEEGIWWNVSEPPANVTLDMTNDGDEEYNMNGAYNITNKTNNLASELNDYLINCNPNQYGFCNITLNITFSGGILKLHNINITYDYNTTHSLQRNDTLVWNETEDIKPGIIYKRRYNIQPSDDLVSVNVSVDGYSMNTSASNCEINNSAKTMSGSTCQFSFNVIEGQYWPKHYIWDDTISEEIAVNKSNKTRIASGIFYQNITLTFRDADNQSTAAAGTFTNTTLEWYYNDSITDNEKIRYYDGQWYEITPKSFSTDCVTSPTYERVVNNSKVWWVCFDTTNKFISLLSESNS